MRPVAAVSLREVRTWGGVITPRANMDESGRAATHLAACLHDSPLRDTPHLVAPYPIHPIQSNPIPSNPISSHTFHLIRQHPTSIHLTAVYSIERWRCAYRAPSRKGIRAGVFCSGRNIGCRGHVQGGWKWERSTRGTGTVLTRTDHAVEFVSTCCTHPCGGTTLL